MKTVELRKQPGGFVLVLLCLLYVFFLSVYFWAIKICLDPSQGGSAPPYVGYIILAIATLMIPVPVILSMVKRFRYAFIKYVLTEDELLCYKGSTITMRIPRTDINLFGSFTAGKSAWIFFCMASEEDISKYADEHWEKRILAFNSNQLDELEKTADGVWRIKVTLYLQFATSYHNGNVITVEFQNQDNLNEISALWKLEPFLAGSYAIEHYAYYSGKGPF